jgi:hypothetical protein
MWNDSFDTSDSKALTALPEKLVSESIHNMRLLVTNVFHMPVSQQTIAAIALCTSLAKFSDVVELLCTKQLSNTILSNAANVTLPPQELALLLSHAATKAHAREHEIVKEPLFTERADCVKQALKFTVLETSGAALWERPAVKIACVLAFQMAMSPLDTLNTIFGSVVLTDLRRCDDLHESEAKKPIDTILIGDMIELVADILVVA